LRAGPSLIGNLQAPGFCAGIDALSAHVASPAMESATEQEPMPYSKVSELPEAQVDQYSTHQKHAFLEAFNNAFEQYGGDEGRAFATAHTAAQRAPKRASNRSDRAAERPNTSRR
jgi:cation transport regulator